jgi:hypothetical protein
MHQSRETDRENFEIVKQDFYDFCCKSGREVRRGILVVVVVVVKTLLRVLQVLVRTRKPAKVARVKIGFWIQPPF